MPDDIVTDTNVQTAYGKNSAAGELATIVTVRGATIVCFVRACDSVLGFKTTNKRVQSVGNKQSMGRHPEESALVHAGHHNQSTSVGYFPRLN